MGIDTLAGGAAINSRLSFLGHPTMCGITSRRINFHIIFTIFVDLTRSCMFVFLTSACQKNKKVKSTRHYDNEVPSHPAYTKRGIKQSGYYRCLRVGCWCCTIPLKYDPFHLSHLRLRHRLRLRFSLPEPQP